MAAIYIPFNAFVLQNNARDTLDEEFFHLENRGQITAYVLRHWTSDIRNIIQVAASTQQIQSGKKHETQSFLAQLGRLYPKRGWALFDRSGLLIASANETPGIRTINISKELFFRQAINRLASLHISSSCFSNRSCVIVSTPVYAQEQKKDTSSSSSPSAVLVMTLGLVDQESDIDARRGFAKYWELERLSSRSTQSESGQKDPVLSLQNNKLKGSEVLMIGNDGTVLFPLFNSNNQLSLLSPGNLLGSAWGPIVRQGLNPVNHKKVGRVTAAGQSFFTYTERVDPFWTMMAVSDVSSLLVRARKVEVHLFLQQLLLLIAVTMVIAHVCRGQAAPILRAAATLRRFSEGDFSARINSTRNDEIGGLFSDIDKTGSNLSTLFQDRMVHAVTDKQLEVARDIQQEFLERNDLSTSYAEIVADYCPAYQIGADWYDVVHRGNTTYAIIADVCDKGIPSALFMSVFRSLIRYSLVDVDLFSSHYGEGELLVSVLNKVNNYMAENHGSSAMFATVFIASYTWGSNKLTFINAGHESPIVISNSGGKTLDALHATGPAVGLFANAAYTPATVSFGLGDMLFAFTDGLVDARSPNGGRFTAERLAEVLRNYDFAGRSAQSLLDYVNSEVANHISSADPFDDKTLLVMRAL